jgi:hypothetical protein
MPFALKKKKNPTMVTDRKLILIARCRKSIRTQKQHGSSDMNDARSQMTPEA